MSAKIVFLIYILFYSDVIFAQTNVLSSVSRLVYENYLELLGKANNVTRVRTVAELNAKGNELAVLDFIGLVQQYNGYKAEEHDVQTEDGYILKLHRISSSPRSPKASNKSVVFIQHGFLGASDHFVQMGPKHDLAYMLADAGYDVWFGNVRGNSYSRRHVKYVPTSFNYDFWKFNQKYVTALKISDNFTVKVLENEHVIFSTSIDDIGTKDAPTFIDKVLEKTNQKKLVYIGYSMGTTMSYMLLSTKPEYNEKIKLSISLAPAAYFAEPFTLFFKFLLTIRRPVISVTDALRIYELFPMSKIVVAFTKTVCKDPAGKILCGLLMSPLLAFQNINFNYISSIIAYFFQGVSPDTTSHLCQLAESKKFRKFDFGPRLNLEKYNLSEPPEYDLSRISAPQAIFYAEKDTFVHPKGATKVKNHMKNVVSFEKVPKSYKHFDFVASKNARTDYYYKILRLVKKFS